MAHYPAQLALAFTAPLMLIGLAAAGIPFLLHFLSRVQAKEEPFPTLRFLKLSMQKNARRRRLQHWLLLLIRSLALAVLAIALAEPISQATGGWLSGKDETAVLVLDNSYSMAAKQGRDDRFALAKAQAEGLLSGEHKPARAALSVSTGPTGKLELTTRLETLREQLAGAQVQYAQSDLAQRVIHAAELLAAQSGRNRRLYVFSDLQTLSLTPLLENPALKAAKDLRVFIIHPPSQPVNNAGIVSLAMSGRPVVDSPMTVEVTVENSSPTPRTVEVSFEPDGQPPTQAMPQLGPAGGEQARATLRFPLRGGTPGELTGRVRLNANDDLLVDNRYQFALKLGPKIKALIVSGPESSADPPALQPGRLLALALDWRDAASRETPWPLEVQTLPAGSLTPADLTDMDIVFFCDVPTVDASLARSVEQFVRRGGTACFFLGPQVRPADYNRRFATLLPGKLAPAVGQVGLDAPAKLLDRVNRTDSLLAGLYQDAEKYRHVLTWRYYPIKADPARATTLLGLAGGDSLLSVRKVGAGRVFWCAAASTPRWSNLILSGIGLPVVQRMAMTSRNDSSDGGQTVTAGSLVMLRRPAGNVSAAVKVALPDNGEKSRTETLPVGPDGTVVLRETRDIGLYHWRFPPEKTPAGALAVNPYGPESDLRAMTPEQLKAALAEKGIKNVYTGASLEEARAAAAAAGEGKNYWDLLILLAILVLTGEALLANRRTSKPTSDSETP